MTPAESLTAFTIEKGALFPFTVEEVADLQDWEPKSCCIAICGDQYRINEADADNILGQILVQAINDNVGDQLTPWVAAAKTSARPSKKQTKPETD